MLAAPTDFPTTQSTFTIDHPGTLRKDPISWYPGHGFYRNKAPDVTIAPKAIWGGRTKNAIAPRDAFLLGLGEGMGGNKHHGHPISDVVGGLLQAGMFNLDGMARLGLATRLLPQLCDGQPELHERIARKMCTILGQRMPENNPWRHVLLRFGETSETEADKRLADGTDPQLDEMPFAHVSAYLAQDVLRDQEQQYFAGLKRLDNVVNLLDVEDQKGMLDEVVELFEAIAVEQGVATVYKG